MASPVDLTYQITLNSICAVAMLPLAQVGRAGRSGEEGWGHMFLSDSDFRKLRSLGHADEVDAGQVESLLRIIFEPDQQYAVIPISKTVNELDMKEEVLDTLISYLEVIY